MSWVSARRSTRARIARLCARRSCCWRRRALATSRSPGGLIAPRSRWRSGDDDFARKGCRVWTRSRGRGARGRFPPAEVAEVKALACELPATTGRPLSRWSAAELAREAVARGIVCSISGTTVWRWLAEDAIRPWAWRSWVFPRDPDFRAKAGRVLDLYERRWQGGRLHPGDYVICADEKTQLQALLRRHPLVAPGAGRPGLVEHEYRRRGSWPTWPRSTSTTPVAACSDAASRRSAIRRSTRWSPT